MEPLASISGTTKSNSISSVITSTARLRRRHSRASNHSSSGQVATTSIVAQIVAAMKGLEHMTPFGKITYRALDHQSTMGAYVGKIGLKDGKGVMTSWSYADGAKFLPSDAEVKKLRAEGETLHKAGKHQESVDTLGKAMKMLNVQ